MLVVAPKTPPCKRSFSTPLHTSVEWPAHIWCSMSLTMFYRLTKALIQDLRAVMLHPAAPCLSPIYDASLSIRAAEYPIPLLSHSLSDEGPWRCCWLQFGTWASEAASMLIGLAFSTPRQCRPLHFWRLMLWLKLSGFDMSWLGIKLLGEFWVLSICLCRWKKELLGHSITRLSRDCRVLNEMLSHT